MGKLTIVIPAYNEEASLPVVLPALAQYCAKNDWELVVVNDGSRDATGTILADYAGLEGVHVITHKVNRGYGGALKSGIRAARTPYVVTMDADRQHEITDVARLFAAISEKDADMVVGRRQQVRTNVYRKLGKRLLLLVARSLMYLPIEDINSGFKLYRTDLVREYMQLCPDGMPFSDIITLTFVDRRHRVIEVDVTVNERLGGKSSISTRTALETVQEIVSLTMRFHPLRIYLPIAVLAVLFGIIWGTPILLMGRGVSVGSMLAIVSGLLLLFIGLLAEQIANLQRSIIVPREEQDDRENK